MGGLPDLPPEAFAKQDRAPDTLFYAHPRFVTHIDDAAIEAVTDLYRKLLPPGGRILDLMSSWISHLPAEVAYGAVIGHGLNARELAANPRLTRHFVQDLNADPLLPLEDTSIDAALICVGVQYLQDPVAVLREVARVLVPGAPVVITFSNRCFPTKAVAIWQAVGGDDHARLIALYLRHAGFSVVEARVLLPDGGPTDPLRAMIGRTPTPIVDAQ
ncbi:class I SAM-dependent methyltransferase [Methylobacterium sp. J-090]|uniref:class I SAM-dependent methyltransferase n=1 Tax=Methylobacterium sp. J-090 TaxID=2836666 RepID=UPI001FBBC6DB|nr:methyltransferase domain-containing protein [Methylobacterium sp. J-090]MCJ2082811.1 methyltransferase domain-containing protein [Methylobacterium sp. J-090]